MVFVFLVFAIGLAIAAYQTKETAMRVFFIACCLLNLAGVGVAIYKNDPYAFKLRPASEGYDPDDRPLRR